MRTVRVETCVYLSTSPRISFSRNLLYVSYQDRSSLSLSRLFRFWIHLTRRSFSLRCAITRICIKIANRSFYCQRKREITRATFICINVHGWVRDWFRLELLIKFCAHVIEFLRNCVIFCSYGYDGHQHTSAEIGSAWRMWQECVRANRTYNQIYWWSSRENTQARYIM